MSDLICSEGKCKIIFKWIKNMDGVKALRMFMNRTVATYDIECGKFHIGGLEITDEFHLSHFHAALNLLQQTEVQCVRDVEYASNGTAVAFHDFVAEMLLHRRASCFYDAENNPFYKTMEQFHETQLKRMQRVLPFWNMVNKTTTTTTTTSTIMANTTEQTHKTQINTKTTNNFTSNITSITTKVRAIDGWMNGPHGPLALSDIKSEICPFKRHNQTNYRRNQITPKFAMKICVRKDHSCAQGLILCYQSRVMSVIRKLNFSKIKVIRTVPFQLVNIEEDPIDQICNNEDLWHDWVMWKNHGFKVSSDGNVVEIRTSYDRKISIAKLNDKSGCAVFRFDQTNEATAAGEEGTFWKIKQAETSPMNNSTKIKEEITDEASTENSTKEVSDANPENSTKTAENEVSETSTENSSTKTATEEEDPEQEEENNEPGENRTLKKFGEYFWRKLRSGRGLRNFDPLVALPYDVLAGVEPNQDLFTVWQHQKKKMASKCQMRITFQVDCSASCVDTPNL